MAAYLLHPSGSLAYHLRAWRFGQHLWAPFHARVHDWLSSWQPPARHLVLLGPSAGYALPRGFLERFSRISVLEPDPLARWLLRRRFPGLAFVSGDAGALAQGRGLHWLAAEYPDAAFLFCNLLGQELQGQDVASRNDWLAGMAPALAGRAWASWHDLASTNREPCRWPDLALSRAEPLEAVLERYWRGGELEIIDHETAGLWPALPRQYAIWPIAPGRWHLIEWLAQR